MDRASLSVECYFFKIFLLGGVFFLSQSTAEQQHNWANPNRGWQVSKAQDTCSVQ